MVYKAGLSNCPSRDQQPNSGTCARVAHRSPILTAKVSLLEEGVREPLALGTPLSEPHKPLGPPRLTVQSGLLRVLQVPSLCAPKQAPNNPGDGTRNARGQ